MDSDRWLVVAHMNRGRNSYKAWSSCGFARYVCALNICHETVSRQPNNRVFCMPRSLCHARSAVLLLHGVHVEDDTNLVTTLVLLLVLTALAW